MMQQTLEQVIPVWERQEKPVILVLNISRFGKELRDRALAAGIPFLTRTDDMLRALAAFGADVRADGLLCPEDPPRPAGLAAVTVPRPGFLTEPQAKAVLRSCGVGVPDAVLAETLDDAVKAATKIGFPVVLKGVVPDVVHKSDRQGRAPHDGAHRHAADDRAGGGTDRRA
ncbi:acetate--CoA ligase family protein [Paracoccus sp. (in: a-proteobacteria)]|uniref:acetate--CoA ligase family protein n=1 Tax=Paracoccus sp. TaxID=267 RepID=UPI003A8B1F21